jgi:DNA-binding FadR family transcriptional regulator
VSTGRSARLKRGRTPLYEGLKRELSRRITTGIYETGARIPTERQLVEDFRVSASTVRRAISRAMDSSSRARASASSSPLAAT